MKEVTDVTRQNTRHQPALFSENINRVFIARQWLQMPQHMTLDDESAGKTNVMAFVVYSKAHFHSVVSQPRQPSSRGGNTAAKQLTGTTTAADSAAVVP